MDKKDDGQVSMKMNKMKVFKKVTFSKNDSEQTLLGKINLVHKDFFELQYTCPICNNNIQGSFEGFVLHLAKNQCPLFQQGKKYKMICPICDHRPGG